MATVGQSLLRIDAQGKVTGETPYGGDLYQKGMLHAKVLRSQYAFANVLSMDVSQARAAAGVIGVYTAADVKGTNKTGLIARDQEVLAHTQVRFMGDALAVVLAETEQAARNALKLIKVEYEPLPALHTIDQALAPDAPRIHEYGNLMGGKRIRKGNAERALSSECDVVVEETFQTQTVDHAFLDVEAGYGEYDGDTLTLNVSGQWVHEERRLCALALGLPIEKVRIIQPATGGAFGGREDISIQMYLGICAMRNPGKKIYLRYTRAESMIARHKRHAIRCHYQLGAKTDGTLCAAKITVWSDEGAYASTGIAVMRKASSHSTGPYRIPNVSVDVYGVHTNNNPTGAMRGFGAAQMAIAYEGMMDRLAKKLGMDRLELRLKNLLVSGEAVTTTQVIPLVTAKECLEAALVQWAKGKKTGDGPILPMREQSDLDASNDDRSTETNTAVPRAADVLESGGGREVARTQHPFVAPFSAAVRSYEQAKSIWDARTYETPAPHLKRGYGISVFCFGLGYGDGFPDASRARVCFNEKDELEVYSGAVEVGQGLLNMIAQVAAEEVGVPIEQVRVIAADTALTPESGSSSATRQTYFTGSAVKIACSELREHLLDVAENRLGVHPLEVKVENGIMFEAAHPDNRVELKEVLAEARRRGVHLEASALFKPRTVEENPATGLSPRAFITYLFGSHIAQVLVDTETGQVKIERLVACHDVGRAINPQQVEGQIQGGVTQGIGMALMEEVLMSEQGKMLNPGFTDYILPSCKDLPFIEAVILEHDDPGGPFGARGIGEPPLIGTTPAVLNAIYDALGVPVPESPATAERVWKAIQQAAT
jgi:CO/xanthine dehydrogenase Mo-binding subunit